MAIDINRLWDFDQPALSEARFRAALIGASPEDALVLQSQIARSYVLRGERQPALEILRAIEANVAVSGSEAQVCYWLELGRAHASPAHPPEALTWKAQTQARQAFQEAFRRAKAAGLDPHTIEALHLMAFTENNPERQAMHERDALRFVQFSQQEAAQRWECAVRIGLAQALIRLQNHAEAVSELQAATQAGIRMGTTHCARSAQWFLGWAYRMAGHLNEALALQLELEQSAAGTPLLLREVLDELGRLYQALGEDERARLYRARALAPLGGLSKDD